MTPRTWPTFSRFHSAHKLQNCTLNSAQCLTTVISESVRCESHCESHFESQSVMLRILKRSFMAQPTTTAPTLFFLLVASKVLPHKAGDAQQQRNKGRFFRGKKFMQITFSHSLFGRFLLIQLSYLIPKGPMVCWARNAFNGQPVVSYHTVVAAIGQNSLLCRAVSLFGRFLKNEKFRKPLFHSQAAAAIWRSNEQNYTENSELWCRNKSEKELATEKWNGNDDGVFDIQKDI